MRVRHLTAAAGIGLAAVLAGVLRSETLLRRCTTEPASYDEGVYASVTALLLDGVVPYRDFVFAQPPGAAVLLAPVAAFEARESVCAGRSLSVAAGVLTVLLVGLLALRAWGAVAGVSAAAAVTFSPDLVGANRLLLEPLLGLLLVAAAAALLPTAGPRRAAAAGVLAAAAVAVKLWALLPAVALLAFAPRGRVAYVAGFAAASALLWLPFLVAAPVSLVEQVLLFQVERPADGVLGAGARLRELLGDYRSPGGFVRSPGAWIVLAAAVGAVAAARDATGRFAAVWAGGAIVAFVAAASFYGHYGEFVAPPLALLAGAGIAALARLPRPAVAVAAAALAAVALPTLPRTLDLADRPRAAPVRLDALPSRATVFAFEPGWLLALNRLPRPLDGELVVDTYASMLLEQGDRRDAATAAQAFAQQPLRTRTFELLRRASYVLLGERGRRQLTRAQLRLFRRDFVRVAASGSVDLWRRR